VKVGIFLDPRPRGDDSVHQVTEVMSITSLCSGPERMRRGSQARTRIHIPAVENGKKGLDSEERTPERRWLGDENDLRRNDDRNVPQKRTTERTMI
jgi:hypothetical protein